MRLEFIIKPRTIGLILGVLGIYLAVQSIFGEYVQATLLSAKLDDVPAQIFDVFSVNAEGTIPNWYSVCILLLASGLLAFIAIAKRKTKAPDASYWIGLAAIFLYLSIDEGAAIHEIFSDPLHNALHTGGFLEFGWQLAAAPLLVIFGVLYLRFLFHLPPRIRNLFILSGVIYVGGAFFGDMVQANQLVLDGGDKLTLLYLSIGTVEELMEMLGIVLFIFTLLTYIVGMQYTAVLHPLGHAEPEPSGQRISVFPHTQTSDSPELIASTLSGKSSRGLIRRLAVLSIAIIVLFNLGLLYWGVTQPPASTTTSSETTPVYQAIVSEYSNDNLLVTHMNGVFNADDLGGRQFAAALLAMYDNVMVVSLPADQSSIFLAGSGLPLDHNSLATLLRANGEFQFVIYEGPAVSAIVGQIPSTPAKH